MRPSGAHWFALGALVVMIGFWLPLTAGIVADGTNSWSAAHGRGTVGNFLGTQKDCARRVVRVCSWKGFFVGPGVNLEHVDMGDSSADLDRDGYVRAVYTGQRHPTKVYLEHGSSAWVWAVAGVVVFTAPLLGVGRFVWPAFGPWCRYGVRRFFLGDRPM